MLQLNWREPVIEDAPVRKTILLAIRSLDSPENGWLELGFVNDDKEWRLEECLHGDHPLNPDKFQVIRWCDLPEWPAEIARSGDADPDEPIIMKDGTIVDTTGKVVNRMPWAR